MLIVARFKTFLSADSNEANMLRDEIISELRNAKAEQRAAVIVTDYKVDVSVYSEAEALGTGTLCIDETDEAQPYPPVEDEI